MTDEAAGAAEDEPAAVPKNRIPAQPAGAPAQGPAPASTVPGRDEVTRHPVDGPPARDPATAAGAGPETEPAPSPAGGSAAQEVPLSPLTQLAAAIRRRPSLSVFLVGLVLFAGGLVSVVGNRVGSATRDLPSQLGSTQDSPAPPEGRVGPEFNEPVGPYIERARSTLAERASSVPADPTLALVVFKEYRGASAVEAFVQARNLDPLIAQVRVPVRGFKPVEVSLEGGSLADAAGSMRSDLTRELATLEAVVSRVTDPAFKTVYENDIAVFREALGLMTTEPETIFALVVRSTHSNLAGVARAPEVRFVDLPDTPTATLEDTAFFAIIPEDTETATFAVP